MNIVKFIFTLPALVLIAALYVVGIIALAPVALVYWVVKGENIFEL